MKKIKVDPYIIFLAFLTAVPASATDMLLSALPNIAKEWNTSTSKAGLSLSLFFVSLSVGLLFFGPLSDKYGRKPILILSTISFFVTSYLCAIATSIDQFLVFRVLQGLSASGANTIAMALTRDKYHGKERQIILAYVGMTMAVVPMVAPTIGAYILSLYRWQVIFYIIAGFSLIPLICTLFMKETNLSLSNESLLRTVLKYKTVMKNKNYMKSLFVLISSSGPFFSFIAFSSVAYIGFFKLDAKMFGYLFALNAMSGIIAGLAATQLVKHLKDKSIITFFTIVAVVASLFIIIFGSSHFMVFASLMTVLTFSISLLRPLGNAIVLEQVKRDIGTAASLMLFYQFIIGAIYMSITTMEWASPIKSYGYTCFITMVILLISWFKTSNDYYASEV